MRFGIILLLLIAACSFVGSFIPQGRELAWYAENYPRNYLLIYFLRLDKMFSNWYFVVMMSLLGLNLTLCTLVRIKSVVKQGKTILPMAAEAANVSEISSEENAALDQFLLSRGCKKTEMGSAKVYSKNLIGRYGSFITHLSILLTIVFGAAALYLPQVVDKDCLPGERVIMPDGTEIAVDSFYIENESGELDFTSHISVWLGKNGQFKEGDISVNYPLSNGPYKIYQQNYGTAGNIRVTNLSNNGTDSFVLTDHAFLSLDGVNGIWFVGLYPDYYKDPQGNIVPVSAAYGRYENPVYAIQVNDNGTASSQLFLPGESVRVGELEFLFDTPVEYPGLRIKYTPPIVNALLFATFALMIVGLYVLFFMQPVIVKVDEEGYAVLGPKPEAMLIDIEQYLDEIKKGNN